MARSGRVRNACRRLGEITKCFQTYDNRWQDSGRFGKERANFSRTWGGLQISYKIGPDLDRLGKIRHDLTRFGKIMPDWAISDQIKPDLARSDSVRPSATIFDGVWKYLPGLT